MPVSWILFPFIKIIKLSVDLYWVIRASGKEFRLQFLKDLSHQSSYRGFLGRVCSCRISCVRLSLQATVTFETRSFKLLLSTTNPLKAAWQGKL